MGVTPLYLVGTRATHKVFLGGVCFIGEGKYIKPYYYVDFNIHFFPRTIWVC